MQHYCIYNLHLLSHLTISPPHRPTGKKYITDGLTALETLAARHAAAHPTDAYLAGPEPTLADAVLIPQLYNARRFNVDLTPFPRLIAVEEVASAHPAFLAAHPDRQPDATP